MNAFGAFSCRLTAETASCPEKMELAFPTDRYTSMVMRVNEDPVRAKTHAGRDQKLTLVHAYLPDTAKIM